MNDLPLRLGIDLGTTRTLVAAADRGNYPVLGLPDADGEPAEHMPSITALRGEELVHGWTALKAAREGAPHLRSVKRVLGDPRTHPGTTVRIGHLELPLLEVLTGYLTALREALPVTPAEVAVAVPAHAHSAQRVMTLEAFRRAGFEVAAMLNEPSAAGLEFTHRHARSLTVRRTRVAVFDLGGGTFDASLVETDGAAHEVLDSVGVNRLGGDDVDAALAALALEAAGIDPASLTAAQHAAVLEQARTAKETLTPQSRRLLVELEPIGAGPDAIVPVAALYEAVTPLLRTAVEAMAPLVGELDADSGVAGIHLVGGASALPLVPRLLKERYGRRVHRSSHPAASTAIGLAIAADPDSGLLLRDRLSRGFGVFRERDAGTGVLVDTLADPSTPLPAEGERTITRRYRAAHDVGWFRFVEHGPLDAAGEPRGDLVPHAQVVFPFAPELRAPEQAATLADRPVHARPDGPEIAETYTVDAAGVITLRISDLDTGYTQRHGLTARDD